MLRRLLADQTNDKEMTEAELLLAMKRQPGVENRHHVLKHVVDFLPVYLKSNERIDAFAFLGYVAVLLHALIERELRNAMRSTGVASLPLYPEGRHYKAPTAARVIEIFEPLCAHELRVQGQLVASFDPNLSKLHHQVLDLLHMPPTAYQAEGEPDLQLPRYRSTNVRKGKPTRTDPHHNRRPRPL